MPSRDDAKRLNNGAEYDIGSRLRELRIAGKLTLRSVADEMGFSIALLSQIENNNISPPLQTLWKLARFYDVSIGSLFSERDEGKRFEVVRKGERALQPVPALAGAGPWHNGDARCCARVRGGTMTSCVVTLSGPLQPDALRRFQAESFIYLLEGSLVLLLGGDEVVLEQGDSIYSGAELIHGIAPGTAAGCVLLVVAAAR